MKWHTKISLIFLLIFISLLVINPASAESNITNTSISYENNNNNISEITEINNDINYNNNISISANKNYNDTSTYQENEKNILKQAEINDISQHNEISNTNYLSSTETGSFYDLYKLINSGSSTIYLDKDYSYNSLIDTNLQFGVPINEIITINGNGHTLYSNGGGIFNVTYSLTVNNVTFQHLGSGVSILNNGQCYINNCTFTGESENPMILNNYRMRITSSNFEKCKNLGENGFIYNLKYLDIDNTIFSDFSGCMIDTISQYSEDSAHCSLWGCEFKNGDISIYNEPIVGEEGHNHHISILNIYNCIFNSVDYLNYGNCTILNSKFFGFNRIENHGNLSVSHSYFNNNRGYSLTNYYEGKLYVNYSSFVGINPYYIYNVDHYNKNGYVHCEFNWWGSNDEKVIDNHFYKAGTGRYAIMIIDVTPNPINITNKTTVTVTLNHDNFNYYLKESLPIFDQFKLDVSGGELSDNYLSLNGFFNTTTYSSNAKGIYELNITLNNQKCKDYIIVNDPNSNKNAEISTYQLYASYNGSVKVQFYKYYTEVVNEGYVTLELENHTLLSQAPVKNGNATLNNIALNIPENETSKVYSVFIIYHGENNYENKIKEVYIEMSQTKLDITSNPIVGKILENVTQNFFITLNNGNVLQNGQIKLYITNTSEIYYGNISNGKATITYQLPNKAGIYDTQFSYYSNDSNNNYEIKTYNTKINVQNYFDGVYLIPDNIKANTDSAIPETVIVHNLDGSNVNNGIVYLKFENQTQNFSAPVTNGICKLLVVTPKIAGNYKTYLYYYNDYGNSSLIFNSTITENSTSNTTNITKSNITYLIGNDFSQIYGQGRNYTVTLKDYEGNPIIGQHIAIKLSRLNGQYKIYWATTDMEGNAMLQINLSPGIYRAESSFNGNAKFNESNINNTITVKNEESDHSMTILTANEFYEHYGAKSNFTGNLKDDSGNVIIGQHIAINLTRLSNGLSKIYWVTTDTDGAFQLAINLGSGEYTAQCSYAGTSKYQSSNAGNTITVIPTDTGGSSSGGSSSGGSSSGGSSSGGSSSSG